MRRGYLLTAALACLLFLPACEEIPPGAPLPPLNTGEDPPPAEATEERPDRELYEAFLAGDISLLDSTDRETWGLDGEASVLFRGEMEYAFLDLDGDGREELLVQWADSPAAYNGVFHGENGVLRCWQSDAAEGSCRDYPLRDGTMVRQYDYGGAGTYTLLRYRADGRTETVHVLYACTERIPEDGYAPCPYYEADGREVDEAEFARQLEQLVTGQLLDRSAWTALRPAAKRMRQSRDGGETSRRPGAARSQDGFRGGRLSLRLSLPQGNIPV